MALYLATLLFPGILDDLGSISVQQSGPSFDILILRFCDVSSHHKYPDSWLMVRAS